jgi:hypothetical protein
VGWQDVERDFPHWDAELRPQLGPSAGWALVSPAEMLDVPGGEWPPWLMLHPCNTARVMGLLVPAGTSVAAAPQGAVVDHCGSAQAHGWPFAYMLRWLVAVMAPAVGLKFDPLGLKGLLGF